MGKIIEIVDTDYYANSNEHIVLRDGIDIKAEYQVWKRLDYKEQRTPTEAGVGFCSTFGAWLIYNQKADYPDEEDFDTFEEDYN